MAYADLTHRKRLIVMDMTHIATQSEAFARQVRALAAENDPARRHALLVKCNIDFGAYVRETRMSLARAVKLQDYVARNTPRLVRE